MIIQSSNVNTASARSYHYAESLSTTYDVSYVSTGVTLSQADYQKYLQNAKENIATTDESDSTNSSDTAEDTSTSIMDLYAQASSSLTSRINEENLSKIDQVRNQIYEYLIRLLFGDDCWDQISESLNGSSYTSSSSGYTMGVESIEATTTSTVSEQEALSFSTNGTVQTADGRNLDFKLNLFLSRSFAEEASTQVASLKQVLIDPLVINTDASVTSLSDQTFYFDLNTDGQEEEVHTLGAGSGFLSLDQNGDGIINDGSELFGTASGNGFSDLEKYDEDKNGWIDEADSVFDQLTVWYKNGTEDRLVKLKEAGVGAICLTNEAGDFSLKDDQNETKGIIRRTGFFLYEEGGAGSLQQVDLTADYSA